MSIVLNHQSSMHNATAIDRSISRINWTRVKLRMIIMMMNNLCRVLVFSGHLIWEMMSSRWITISIHFSDTSFSSSFAVEILTRRIILTFEEKLLSQDRYDYNFIDTGYDISTVFVLISSFENNPDDIVYRFMHFEKVLRKSVNVFCTRLKQSELIFSSQYTTI